MKVVEVHPAQRPDRVIAVRDHASRASYRRANVPHGRQS